MKTLRELYMGKVTLETSPKSEYYNDAISDLDAQADKIRDYIKNDEQLSEMFEDYIELCNEYASEEGYCEFIQGFALGLNLKKESKEILKEIEGITFE